MNLISHQNITLDSLPEIALEIGKVLRTSKSFAVWLDGPMGAGKTTLVESILRSYGLNDTYPVHSPTFTYVNEHNIDDVWYAHLDLYRTDEGFSLDNLGIFDTKNYAGVFVEWPKKNIWQDLYGEFFKIQITPKNDLERDILVSRF